MWTISRERVKKTQPAGLRCALRKGGESARARARGQICAPALDHAVEAALIYIQRGVVAGSHSRGQRRDAISGASIVSRSAS